MYDLIIIGLGPAGMSAGIYAKRNNSNVIAINNGLPGGLVNQASLVDNYLGFKDIEGPELASKMYEHFKSYGINEVFETVINIKDEGEYKTVVTNKSEYNTKAVIIATGRKNRRLAVANADKFEGKGISYCALCDGNLYKDQTVVIVGAGNSAFEESLYLAQICKKVIVLIRGDQIRAVKYLKDQLESTSNIEILYNAQIDSVNGNETVEGITLKDGRNIASSGIFVYIGLVPSIEFAKEIGIANEQGYINVDENQETKIKGIFACGDIVNKNIYQISTAVSDGVIAAMSANRYRNNTLK